MQTKFVAIYRWRIAPDKDLQFRDAWRRLTELIATHRGSHGSRLHRAEDGTYVAIALWPSREAWAATVPALPDGDASLARLRDAVVESFPTQLLDVIDDGWSYPPVARNARC